MADLCLVDSEMTEDALPSWPLWSIDVCTHL